MKFDLDTAWKDTSRLFRDNFGLLAVLAGVFYFIPYAVMMLAIPEFAALSNMSSETTPEAMQEMLFGLYGTYWWVFLIFGIVQAIGLLAMLALLSRRANPTVGEALKTGAGSVITYLVANIAQSLCIVLLFGVLVGVPVALGLNIVAVFLAIAAAVVALYLLTKFSMVSPIIAIDGERNPIAALMRSWHLTRGNSVRLFFFFVLVVVAFVIVSSIISMIISLVFSLGGAEAALFGTTIASSLMQAFFIMLFVCLAAAMHMQLTRLRTPRDEVDLEA